MKDKQEQKIEGLSKAETELVLNAKLGNETLLTGEDGLPAEVRATVIKALVTGEKYSEKHEIWDIHQSGLQIRGGNITGSLELDNSVIKVPLTFFGVQFKGAIFLREAETKRITLKGGCKISDIYAENAVVDGSFTIANTTSSGILDFEGMSCRSMNLDNTKITGFLNLRNLKMEGEFKANKIIIKSQQELALDANGLVCSDVFLNGADINGISTFISAKITDQFNAEKAKFTYENKVALNCQGLSCVDVHLSETTIKGECSFSGAEMSGQFVAVDATFSHPNGDALNAQQLCCRALILNKSKFYGLCDLTAISIDGPFQAKQTEFTVEHPEESVEQSVCLNLKHANLTAMQLAGVKIHASNQIAIQGEGMNVNSFIHIEKDKEKDLEKETEIDGDVCFAMLSVSGELAIDDSQLMSKLDLHEAKLGKLRLPKKQNSLQGVVDLSRAKVGTFCDFKASWPNKKPNGSYSAGKAYLKLDGFEYDFLENPSGTEQNVFIELKASGSDKIRKFYKDTRSKWLCEQIASMRGSRNIAVRHVLSRYLRSVRLAHYLARSLISCILSKPKTDIFDNRKEWLNSQVKADLDTNFRPQPWYQLAKVLNASGYEDDARRISIQRRIELRKCGKTTTFEQFTSFLLHLLADYGFNPWKTLIWSIIFVALFSIFYDASSSHCSIKAPLCSDDKVFVRVLGSDLSGLQGVSGNEQNFLKETYPSFNTLLYSLDVFLPLLDLGTEPYWRPNEHFVTEVKWLEMKEFQLGLLLQVLTILEQIIGAILISLMVTGFTGMLTRDEK